MTVRPLTRILTVALAIVSVFAAWSLLRPYEWNADPVARFRIRQVRVTRDHSYYWVEVFLKGVDHDLQKRVSLETANGRSLDPADTTLSGDEGKGITELWFRFWLDSTDVAGPLKLHLNDRALVVRSASGAPALQSGENKVFLTNSW